MTYRIGGYGDDWLDWPTTLRQFWQRSYAGAFTGDYQTGFDAGIADLAANSYAFVAELHTVEAAARDTAWHAKLDGYREATHKRGLTDFGI